METILIASCRILLSLFVIFEHVNICRFIYSSVHFHFHSSLSTFLSSFSAGCSLGRRQTRFSIFFRHLRDFFYLISFSHCFVSHSFNRWFNGAVCFILSLFLASVTPFGHCFYIHLVYVQTMTTLSGGNDNFDDKCRQWHRVNDTRIRQCAVCLTFPLCECLIFLVSASFLCLFPEVDGTREMCSCVFLRLNWIGRSNGRRHRSRI